MRNKYARFGWQHVHRKQSIFCTKKSQILMGSKSKEEEEEKINKYEKQFSGFSYFFSGIVSLETKNVHFSMYCNKHGITVTL